MLHYDVIKWKHFPRYWPFVRGIPGEFPTQRPVTRSFDVFFYLRPNTRLSKQSWGWWFETPSRPLWRHRNVHTSRPGTHVRVNSMQSCSLNTSKQHGRAILPMIFSRLCPWLKFVVLNTSGWIRRHPFCRHFQINFLNENYRVFIKIVLKIFREGVLFVRWK